MVPAHVAARNALKFFSVETVRSEALISLQFIFFSEQPFYGLDSHTNTVIFHAVAYSSRLLPKL